MPGKFDGRRRGRQQWVEPAEREWCVRRLQHDQVIPLGSLTYRQAALVIALLSTVLFIIRAGLPLSNIFGVEYSCEYLNEYSSTRLNREFRSTVPRLL